MNNGIPQTEMHVKVAIDSKKSRPGLNYDRTVLTTLKGYTKSLSLPIKENTSQPSTGIIAMTEMLLDKYGIQFQYRSFVLIILTVTR